MALSTFVGAKSERTTTRQERDAVLGAIFR